PFPRESAAGAPAREEAATAPSRPQVTWSLPPGWREIAAGNVSVAAFSISGEGGEAKANITPLPNLRGREAIVVNLSRTQAGLPSLEADELSKELAPVEIGDESGQLFEIAGKGEDGKPIKIITAFAHQQDASWFYKLSGDETIVTAQRPAFLEFLKSIRMTAPAPSAAPAETASAPAPGAAEFKWQVPPGWKTVTPGQMQAAKFAVPARGNAGAEVSVSVFPSDTGGTLANVNRWRGQLGLGPVDESGLAPLAAPLDPSLPNAVIVTLSNEPRHLLGAIVPRDGRWWFYKMLGDGAAVTAERDAFLSFAKSTP
nr:hypothetical protein [Verrucomicrobiota bacterium]